MIAILTVDAPGSIAAEGFPSSFPGVEWKSSGSSLAGQWPTFYLFGSSAASDVDVRQDYCPRRGFLVVFWESSGSPVAVQCQYSGSLVTVLTWSSHLQVKIHMIIVRGVVSW